MTKFTLEQVLKVKEDCYKQGRLVGLGIGLSIGLLAVFIQAIVIFNVFL